MMGDQERDQRLGLIAIGRHRRQGGVAFAFGAGVGLLAGIELGVDPEAMLQIVDAQRGGFRVAHRAKMAGEFQAMAVRLFDGGAQLGAGDVHVGLVGSRALRRPEGDGGACVRRIGELVHLDEGAVGAFEIGRRHVHVWPHDMTRIDLMLEVEIGIGFDAAGGAQGGDAQGEIEPGRGKGHLRHHQRLVAVTGGIQIGAGDVIHMVVHAHQAGHHAFARRVDAAIAGGNSVGGGLDGGDAAILDQHGPVGQSGRAGAVNDAHMGQGNPAGFHFDKRFDGVAGGGWLRQHARRHVERRGRGGAKQKHRGERRDTAEKKRAEHVDHSFNPFKTVSSRPSRQAGGD